MGSQMSMMNQASQEKQAANQQMWGGIGAMTGAVGQVYGMM